MSVNSPTSDERFARFDLTGQVAWVAGGAGHLGSSVVRALADHGAHVVISDRRGDLAEALAAELVRLGLSVTSAALDVTDTAAIDRQAADILADHGRLDIAVYLPSYSTGLDYDDLDSEALAVAYQVHLTGPLVFSRAAARSMTAGGRIILFGSMYGSVSPQPHNYPEGVPVNPVEYGMSKAAIPQLVRYQAVKFAPRNILVNAVIPGPFPKPQGQGAVGEFVSRLERSVPLGRIGEAPEIAGAVVFLASPAASYVTGTQIVVDGGWTAW